MEEEEKGFLKAQGVGLQPVKPKNLPNDYVSRDSRDDPLYHCSDKEWTNERINSITENLGGNCPF